MLVPKEPRVQVLRTQRSPSATGANLPEEVASELGLDSRVRVLGPRGTDEVGETKTRVERTMPLGAPREAQELEHRGREGQRGSPAWAEGPGSKASRLQRTQAVLQSQPDPHRSHVLSAGAEL